MCAPPPGPGGRDYTARPVDGGSGAAGTLTVAAQPDQASPALVIPGSQVVGFGDRNESEVDAWIPFKFSFSPPPDGADRATFVLVVRPIGQLVDTDSFHCGDAEGKGVALYRQFASLPTSKPSVVRVTIDRASHPKVMQQLDTGTLRCCVQDDTALFSAKMIVESGAGPRP